MIARLHRAMALSDRAWWQWIALGWAMVLFFAWGPSIERVVFPVISKFQIVEIEPDGVGSRIWVRFEKYRGCQFLGLTWQRVLPDGSLKQAVIRFRTAGDTSGSTRPEGRFDEGPWYVKLAPDDLMKHSSATISYRCLPFWTTQIQVWP
jgi:hypothetical protein